ncbi:hypothetical protein G4B88_002508 [Cannabis sativa]|nr:hypothetical protein G4B88_002508 [Cannabis sativa]
MDELLKKTHNLQVTDEDDWEIDKSLSITIAKFNLRGRLCTNAEHSRGFLKRVLGGIWRLKETKWNIKIKEKFDTGLFLTFTFASESIQNKILTEMPWYLSNGLLILWKMENSNESWANDLTNFPIWGKAMGVPTDLLTKNNTTRMANKAGAVIQVQNSDVSRMVADGFFRFQTDNGCRDGFQGKRTGMGQANIQGRPLNKNVTEWETAPVNSNAFASLPKSTTGGIEHMLTEASTHKEPMQQLEQGVQAQELTTRKVNQYLQNKEVWKRCMMMEEKERGDWWKLWRKLDMEN